jgi:T5orf172 domain
MSITRVPPEVRDEMHRWLAQSPQSPTILARFVRGDTDGISHRDLGYLRLDVDQILGDQPTTYAWRAYSQLTKLERMRASEGISDGLAAYLDEEIPQLAKLARKYRPVRDEAQAKEKSRYALLRNEPGVYVFALPHYLRHPYDEDTGDTLFKVGMSKGVVGRFLGQTRTTALPEDPILLRVYRAENPAEEEHRFHGLLKAARQTHKGGGSAGREWFLTSLTLLDEIAELRGLTVAFRNDEVDAE